ncbi:beta-glucosidase [Metabacillus sediminilitoris]|nr:glycoside hydrolase family 3 C-terminal domain-containing protein [Metabacillus sediminilitoris]
MLKKMKKKRRQMLAIALATGVAFSGFSFQSALAANEGKAGSQQSDQISKEVPQLIDKASIDAVIAAMTVEEKAKLVVGVGMPGMTIPKLSVAGAVGGTPAIERLGIPAMFYADGPAGLRISPTRPGETKTYYSTAFPIATSLASTWDTSVVNKVGQAQGNEVKEYGVDVLLAPALNLHRNLLNGRNFEYFSEDPVITGKMTAALVNGVQSNGVGATVKHFAANNQETNRFTIDTIVSERALRELYLKGFEIAVKESNPKAVMSSYNLLNGTPASQNEELLTTVLRGDWGYKGYVMTDWFAGTDPVAQMKAGNDQIMPGSPQSSDKIVDAVKNGKLDEAILDRNVKNILNFVVESPSFKNYAHSDNPDLDAHAKVARQAAADGMVLLKNDYKALPLKKENKIALFGTAQIETVKGGTGSGDVNAAYTVSVVDGLKHGGYKLHDELISEYNDYISELRAMDEYKIKPSPWGEDFGKVIPVIPEKVLNTEHIEKIQNESDIGVIVIGRNSGEGVDRQNVKGDYLLTDAEQEMIENISKAYHEAGKKVAVVLNIGGPVEVASWRDKVDSILVAWQPGQEAGDAIADVLTGAVNPSGKLATTFPVQYSDVPSAENFPGTPEENPTQVVYEEDIYVGYRYHSTFNVKPAYEFGYGLSYTSFDYSNIRVSNGGTFKDEITVFTNVKNTGAISGKEAVQVYVTAPDGKLEKPEIELKAFGKTKELNANQSQLLKFDLNAKDLASYDEENDQWIVEKGTYTVKVGASSENIKGTATFKVAKDIVVEEVSNSLEPQVEINKLTKN